MGEGGWFVKHQPDVFSASTAPSTKSPTSQSTTEAVRSVRPEDDSTDRERERLNSLQTDAVHAESAASNPGDSGKLDASTLGGIT